LHKVETRNRRPRKRVEVLEHKLRESQHKKDDNFAESISQDAQEEIPNLSTEHPLQLAQIETLDSTGVSLRELREENQRLREAEQMLLETQVSAETNLEKAEKEKQRDIEDVEADLLQMQKQNKRLRKHMEKLLKARRGTAEGVFPDYQLPNKLKY
jgi:hypothetical protein